MVSCQAKCWFSGIYWKTSRFLVAFVLRNGHNPGNRAGTGLKGFVYENTDKRNLDAGSRAAGYRFDPQWSRTACRKKRRTRWHCAGQCKAHLVTRSFCLYPLALSSKSKTTFFRESLIGVRPCSSIKWPWISNCHSFLLFKEWGIDTVILLRW